MTLPVPDTIRAADGAEAQIYAQGAHLIRWRSASGAEPLFLSQRSAFTAGTAIRGGVPVIFPQFAAEGPLAKHGFARTAVWQRQPDTEPGAACWQLRDSAATRAAWPHAFRCELRLRIGGERLDVALSVHNSGDQALRFTAALHTYLRVDDIGAARLHGLQQHRYRDSAHGGIERVEADESLAIVGEVDRIYFDTPAALRLSQPGSALRIEQQGFCDTVVWNPGPAKGAALTDLEQDGDRHLLCVEAAVVGRPVSLAPGAHWQGSQTLIIGG